MSTSAASSAQLPAAVRDFDFLVEFEPLPNAIHADAYFGLLDDLTKLLGRPVDLVVADVIRNPYFRQSIEATKALIYAA